MSDVLTMQWGPLHRKGTLLSTSTLDRKWKAAILPGSAPWASTARWRMPSCRTSWTRRRTSWGGPRRNSGSTSRTTSDHRWTHLHMHIYTIYIIYTSIFTHISNTFKTYLLSTISISFILAYLYYHITYLHYLWSNIHKQYTQENKFKIIPNTRVDYTTG